MREQLFVDRRFIYNFIRNQNELDGHDMMQFYTVQGIKVFLKCNWASKRKSKQVIVDRLP